MTPPDCPPAAELAAFHAGRLADDRIAAVGRHLDTCTRCRAAPAPAPLPPTTDHPPTRFDAEAGCARARQRVSGIAACGLGVGHVLGDFRLLRELGRGGMGVVYEAEQRSLGRRVAVKVVQARGAADPDLMRRFEREAKAVGRLHHTNIVPVFGVGEYSGSPFYAMQLVRGGGLNEVIAALARKRNGEPERDALADRLARPLTPRAAAGLIAQAAVGVGHAHDQGVLHRDVKPSNLLLDVDGTVWVTDFGLAKTDDTADLTHTGDLLGTVRYMAPEAFDGKADRRSDVYALGLTLYELLALRPAFDGADRGQVMRAVIDARPTPLRTVAPEVPRDLETIVARSIDRDPARRYQTAHALADDLRRFVRDEPILARRAGPVEQLARWAKRNRGLAAALAGLAVTLVGVTVGSLVAAGRFRDMAKEQTELAASEGNQRRLAQEAEAAGRANLYAAEMSLAARVAELPTGLPRLRELVSHWENPGEGRIDPRGWEWRLFRALCRQERYVRTDRLYHAVAWSPDGRRLAVAADGRIEMLDPADGTPIGGFRLADGDAFSLMWGADGRRLVVGHYGGVVCVYDAGTGERLYRAGHGVGRTTGCLHPGGNLLASHSDDRTVRVHDIAAGKVVAVLPGAAQAVPAEFAFSPDGRRLATAHTDERTNRECIAVWDTATWERVRTVAATLDDRFTSVRWADNTRVVLPTFKSGILVWDVEADTRVRQLAADRHIIPAVDVTADGRRVAAGDWGRLVWVWDTDTGKRVAAFRGHTVKVYRVAIAPDGSRVATVAQEWNDSALRVWDVTGRQPVRTFDPPTAGEVRLDAGLAWHPDGGRVAGATARSVSGIYDLGGKPTADRRGRTFTWDRTGRRAAAQFDDEVCLYDDARTDPVRTLPLPGLFKSFDWHPTDGRLAIRVGLQLWVYDPARPDPPTLAFGEPHPPGRVPYEPCGAVAWHPDGRTVALAGRDDDGWCVRLIDPATRTAESQFRSRTLTIWAVKWSPDGGRLAVAGDGPAIRVFDPATGTLVQSLSGHTFTVRDLAYSPDGARLASAGLDGNVLLWDTKSGRLILSFELGSPVLGVAWSRDGAKLAALTETGAVKVWDAGGSD